VASEASPGDEEALEGAAFYDQPSVFEIYSEHRLSANNPNDLMEGPTFLELLGPARGLRIVELGCGDAGFGRQLLAAGCQSYTGVDASQNMAEAAKRTLRGTAGLVRQERLESFLLESGTLDLVVSRLALHYVDDLAAVLQRVHRALVPGGRLVFSVEHPIITSCDRGWDQSGPRGSWVVDDYFRTGKREMRWLGARVQKYHRTVEDYIGLVQQAGFRLDSLREARPRPDLFVSTDEFQRRSRIPLFLLLASTRV